VSEEELPMLGAEDFAFFMMAEHGGKIPLTFPCPPRALLRASDTGRPGCYFFLGSSQEELCALAELPDMTEPGAFAKATRRSNCTCHGIDFDFNDNLLPLAGALWVRIVEARLGAELYSPEELDAAQWQRRVLS
jgi:metal-dependent amidase/aminoacylase/carboxypeptidase family protein